MALLAGEVAEDQRPAALVRQGRAAPRQMHLPPGAQRDEHGQELASGVGQDVRLPRSLALVLVRLGGEDAGRDELAQPAGDDGLREAGAPDEVVETAGPVGRLAQQEDRRLVRLGEVPPLLVGAAVGLVSGYFGGVVDSLFMRLYDLFVAFPFFVLVLAIVGVLGPGLVNFVIALALVGWVSYARLVRAEVLTIRESEYVQAAQCLGYPPAVIVTRHVLPNAVGPVIAYAVSDAVLVMLAGASFGFLGMGAQPPNAEWGVMIADGQSFIDQAWWICFFPGAAAITLGLGLAFLGDALAQLRRPVRA